MDAKLNEYNECLAKIKEERAQHRMEVLRTADCLANLPDPAKELDSVYAQFLMYRTKPDDYQIPDDFVWAEEVICGFDKDEYEGFLEFARTVVDAFPKRSEERRPVQEVFRKINGWADACRRRQLVSWLEHGYDNAHGSLPAGRIKRDYIEGMLKIWSNERQRGLSALSLHGKSSYEERVEFLSNFWRVKHKESWEGMLPHWKEFLEVDEGTTNDETRKCSVNEQVNPDVSQEQEPLSCTDRLQFHVTSAAASLLSLKAELEASGLYDSKTAKQVDIMIDMVELLRSDIDCL